VDKNNKTVMPSTGRYSDSSTHKTSLVPRASHQENNRSPVDKSVPQMRAISVWYARIGGCCFVET
jgi:hypothetical protein